MSLSEPPLDSLKHAQLGDEICLGSVSSFRPSVQRKGMVNLAVSTAITSSPVHSTNVRSPSLPSSHSVSSSRAPFYSSVVALSPSSSRKHNLSITVSTPSQVHLASAVAFSSSCSNTRAFSFVRPVTTPACSCHSQQIESPIALLPAVILSSEFSSKCIVPKSSSSEQFSISSCATLTSALVASKKPAVSSPLSFFPLSRPANESSQSSQSSSIHPLSSATQNTKSSMSTSSTSPLLDQAKQSKDDQSFKNALQLSSNTQSAKPPVVTIPPSSTAVPASPLPSLTISDLIQASSATAASTASHSLDSTAPAHSSLTQAAKCGLSSLQVLAVTQNRSIDKAVPQAQLPVVPSKIASLFHTKIPSVSNSADSSIRTLAQVRAPLLSLLVTKSKSSTGDDVSVKQAYRKLSRDLQLDLKVSTPQPSQNMKPQPPQPVSMPTKPVRFEKQVQPLASSVVSNEFQETDGTFSPSLSSRSRSSFASHSSRHQRSSPPSARPWLDQHVPISHLLKSQPLSNGNNMVLPSLQFDNSSQSRAMNNSLPLSPSISRREQDINFQPAPQLQLHQSEPRQFCASALRIEFDSRDASYLRSERLIHDLGDRAHPQLHKRSKLNDSKVGKKKRNEPLRQTWPRKDPAWAFQPPYQEQDDRFQQTEKLGILQEARALRVQEELRFKLEAEKARRAQEELRLQQDAEKARHAQELRLQQDAERARRAQEELRLKQEAERLRQAQIDQSRQDEQLRMQKAVLDRRAAQLLKLQQEQEIRRQREEQRGLQNQQQQEAKLRLAQEEFRKEREAWEQRDRPQAALLHLQEYERNRQHDELEEQRKLAQNAAIQYSRPDWSQAELSVPQTFYYAQDTPPLVNPYIPDDSRATILRGQRASTFYQPDMEPRNPYLLTAEHQYSGSERYAYDPFQDENESNHDGRMSQQRGSSFLSPIAFISDCNSCSFTSSSLALN